MRQGQSADMGIRPIEPSSAIPYYYQLQEILKEEIEHGRWKPGELIPSEGNLANMFGVSRTVIRKALDILEADGQVYRVKGKGTVVAKPKFRYEAISAAEGWRQGNLKVVLSLERVLDTRRVPVGGHVGRLLQLSPQEEVFQLTFVQSAEGSPASLSQVFLRTDAAPALEHLAGRKELPSLREGGPEAFIQLDNDYDLEILESEVTVEATLTNEFESGVLNTPLNSSIFLLSSIDVGLDRVPLAFTRTLVRSDQFHFSVVIRRMEHSRLS